MANRATADELSDLRAAAQARVAAWVLDVSPDEVPHCTCADQEHTLAEVARGLQLAFGNEYLDAMESFAAQAASNIHDLLFPGNAVPKPTAARIALFVCAAFFAGWAGALKAAASDLPENVIPFPSVEQEW